MYSEFVKPIPMLHLDTDQRPLRTDCGRYGFRIALFHGKTGANDRPDGETINHTATGPAYSLLDLRPPSSCL
jgi:hypothetical protein